MHRTIRVGLAGHGKNREIIRALIAQYEKHSQFSVVEITRLSANTTPEKITEVSKSLDVLAVGMSGKSTEARPLNPRIAHQVLRSAECHCIVLVEDQEHKTRKLISDAVGKKQLTFLPVRQGAKSRLDAYATARKILGIAIGIMHDQFAAEQREGAKWAAM